jgi:hypothetical protein
MNYQTSIGARPPVALSQLAAPPPGTNRGVYDGLAQKNQVELDRSAQAANAGFVQQAAQAQQQMAMRGMEMAAQQQNNNRSLNDQRFNQASNYFNSILGGLYG